MRILIYGINYAPELIGIGKYTTEMCEWLASQGNEVEVITGMPSYPNWKVFDTYRKRWWFTEIIRNVRVHRSPLYVPKNVNRYAYDPAKARQLLQAAGWNTSQNVEVITYYNDQLSKDVLVTLQQMFAQVGLKITPRFLDTPSYNQATSGTGFSLVYAGIGNGPDPDTLYPSMHSDFMPPNGTKETETNVRYEIPTSKTLIVPLKDFQNADSWTVTIPAEDIGYALGLDGLSGDLEITVERK